MTGCWLHLVKLFLMNYQFAIQKNIDCSSQKLSVDWIGQRMYRPSLDEVKKGFIKPLDYETHYIQSARYPNHGGYFSFAKKLYAEKNIFKQKEVKKVDLKSKNIIFSDGKNHSYDILFNTIPLPDFVKISNLSKNSLESANQLRCSSLLIINLIANHASLINENWAYVYDEDKYSTRINFVKSLSPNNGLPNKTGIQVEVYFSEEKFRLRLIAKSKIGSLMN